MAHSAGLPLPAHPLETSPLSGFPGDWRLFREWSGGCFAFMAKTLVISTMDRGKIGIIRSPVRASILPDLLVMFSSNAGSLPSPKIK